MAALTFHAVCAVQFLRDLSDAFVRSGYNIRKSLRYLQTKRRLLLFRRHCRELWLEEDNKRNALIEKSQFDWNSTRDIPSAKVKIAGSAYNLQSKSIRGNMQPISIDFDAVEAADEVDSFTELHYAALDDNFEDIEVLNATEMDTTFYEYLNAVPVYYNHIGKLHGGDSFTFTGRILVNCERFSINFVLGNETQDVALHINPRLPQNYIVRNTKTKQVWGNEEVSSALPFSLHRGSDFAIQVLVTELNYMISVNGLHFAKFQHRLPYTAVSVVEVKGDVENVKVERSKVEEYPARLPESGTKEVRLSLTPAHSVDSGVEDSDSDVANDIAHIPEEWRKIPAQNTSPLHNVENKLGLPLPYLGSLPENSLRPGRQLKIEGRVKLLPHSFYINLQHGQHFWPHPTIAFHFNPRFSKQSGAIGKAIVCRNAWYNGKWANEERSELDTDFRPGKIFSLVICCGEEAFQVYVNRKYMTEFRYHMSPNVVDTIYIQGDIKLWDVALVASDNKKTNVCLYQNPGYAEDS